MTVGEDYPKQQARCREILGAAKEIGPAGKFLVAMMEDILRRADEAAISGDVVSILRLYQEMKDVKE
jgi:phosphoserine aminotransferase